MKCVAIERSRHGWLYTVTVETKWLFFKSQRKYMTIRPISGGYEWMELPNATKVDSKTKEQLDIWVKEHKKELLAG